MDVEVPHSGSHAIRLGRSGGVELADWHVVFVELLARVLVFLPVGDVALNSVV